MSNPAPYLYRLTGFNVPAGTKVTVKQTDTGPFLAHVCVARIFEHRPPEPHPEGSRRDRRAARRKKAR
jgi:hypothetical protein